MLGPAKVLCRVPERSHHHLDRTRAAHGMTRGPRRRRSHLPGCIDPLVSQHCLVDPSQRSTKLWAKARRIKHVPRVKYGGILAVAYDEHRRLLIERTIGKWKNSALRYRAECKWRCVSVPFRVKALRRAAHLHPSIHRVGVPRARAAQAPPGASTGLASTRIVCTPPRPSSLPSMSVVADGADVRKGSHSPATLPCCPKLA